MPLFGEFHLHLHPKGRVALDDPDREDGAFHEDPRDVLQLGFDREDITEFLAEAGFGELAATTAAVTRKNSREYPIFRITATKRR